MQTYSTGAGITPESIEAIVMIVGLLLALALVSYFVTAIFLGKIFAKAGQPAWAAWVPIYNSWMLLKLGGQPPFWALLLLVPGLNVVALIYLCIAGYYIGLKLQKEGWFVLLMIFLPVVWTIWLGVDDSTWQGEGNDTQTWGNS